MAPYRSSQLFGALILLTVLTWLGWNFKQSDIVQTQPITQQPDREGTTSPDSQSLDVTDASVPSEPPIFRTLCYYGICDISPDALLSYGKVNIDVVETPSFEAPLLQNVSTEIPELAPLDSIEAFMTPSVSISTATVEIISKPKPATASNLILGVATNIDRLEESLDQFSHWASNNGARIIALVPNTSLAVDIDRTFEKSLALKLNLTILSNEMAFDDRYFHLASLMYNYSTTSTEWATFIDDDTFFPDMARLQTLLAKHASPKTTPWYVGALSEDFHQLFKWGFMAYGGGGVFVSMALLRELVPHLPSCVLLAHTGDARLAQCIFSHTTTKLTLGPGLFQLDLWGDGSGFYEALRPQPVSVHHWKSWHKFDMVNISRVSTICGDACIFQKYRFANDWQLTNGFSVVKYSEGNERSGDDQRMEKTWWDSQGGTWDMFLHSVAPLRPRDENKIQYLLEGSVNEDGTVRQFYVKRSRLEDDRPQVQILELAWRKKEKFI